MLFMVRCPDERASRSCWSKTMGRSTSANCHAPPLPLAHTGSRSNGCRNIRPELNDIEVVWHDLKAYQLGPSDIHRRRRTRWRHSHRRRRPEPRAHGRSVGQATNLWVSVPGVKHEKPPLRNKYPDLQHAINGTCRAPIGRGHAFTGNLDPFVGSVLPTRPILCKLTQEDFVIAGSIDPVLSRPTVAFRTTRCTIALCQRPNDIPIRSHLHSV